MRHRSVGMSVFLTIITCGIYGIYWFICLTDDSNEATGIGQTTGGMAMLFSLITCGIYSIYWGYKMGEKLDQARFDRGVPPGSQAILYLVLSIFGLQIVAWALIQSELNRYYFGGDDF
ncbi:MAG: DUF4234 domain-containing protein [Pseudoflavonifractor sp.]